MGYYASFTGEIVLNKRTPGKLFNLIEDTWEDYQEIKEDGTIVCEIRGYDKYWSDTVEDTLEKIKPYVISGQIDYVGEDYDLWAYIFEDGTWKCTNGKVYYLEYDEEELLKEAVSKPAKEEALIGSGRDEVLDKLLSKLEH